MVGVKPKALSPNNKFMRAPILDLESEPLMELELPELKAIASEKPGIPEQRPLREIRERSETVLAKTKEEWESGYWSCGPCGFGC